MNEKLEALVWAHSTRNRWSQKHNLYIIINVMLFIPLLHIAFYQSVWFKVVCILYVLLYLASNEYETLGVMNADILNEPSVIEEFVYHDVTVKLKMIKVERRFMFSTLLFYTAGLII